MSLLLDDRTEEQAMKICVFGAGAIGGYMAGELALAGHEVCQLPAVRIWRPFGATGSS
jgi:choline dehydrogenase-like flavoprotein